MEYHENRETFLRKVDNKFVVDLMENGILVKTVDLSQSSLDAEEVSDNWMMGIEDE